MGRQQIQVQVQGITPLLMHRFPLEPIEALEKKSAKEQAEIAAYRDPDKKLYIPATAMQRALVAGATYIKGRGRASLQKPVAACVFVSPEYLILTPQEYTLDTRAVVVPSTKGRVLRHRPRFDQWAAHFTLEYDDTLLTSQQLRQVTDATGTNAGLLDFRPEKKGPYGRFQVNRWDTGSPD